MNAPRTPSVHACGCPAGPAITDQARHDLWHQLVAEQGGPLGAVNTVSLRAARGHLVLTADSVMAPIAARNERQGKSSPGWRREAAR